MTESIGTARLDIVVDTSSLDAGVTKAKRTTQDMANAAKGASASMEQNTKRQIASLEKQIATLGKSKEEIIRWRIEQQTSGKVAADLAAKLEQQVKHLGNGGKAMNAYGLSAKQTAQALRGVPAQITDIATALGSGQRPLTVLLQQGGQLKDMFGGIVPAARALGGAIMGLINPYTLAAAAVVGLGIAAKEAADEQEAFGRALVLTGNNAGLTTEKLRGMARELDSTTNITEAKASAILAQVAATGEFTAAQIKTVAEAAANMADATGRSVEQTIRDFASLKGDPLDAIIKLNDAIGDGTNVTHFLTQAQVEQIAKLQEQGREADATALAMTRYADAINNASPQIVQNMTTWTLLWRDIKHGASEAGDAVIGFLRDSRAANLAAQSFRNLLPFHAPEESAPARSSGASLPQFNIPGLGGSSRPFSAAPAFDSRAFAARRAAEDEFGKIRESHLSKAKQLEAEITHIREVGAKAGASQAAIEEQVAAARAAAATHASGGGGGRAPRASVSTARALPDFSKDAAAELAKQAEAEDRATQSFLDMAATLDGPLAQAQREHEKRVRQLNELAQQSPVAASGLAAALDDEARSYAKTTAEIQKQLDPVGQVLAAQALELDQIGKSNAERAVMNALIERGIDLRGADAQAALAQARANQTEFEARQKSIQLMDAFRQDAANALTDFVTGAKSAKDALKDFFNELAAQITRAIAEKWIAQAFGQQGSSGGGTNGGGWLSAIMGLFSGGSANGNAFSGGNVMAYANGGVVNRTTPFGMSGGRFGIMGEAGPEAILPLKRGADGKLGVSMDAGSGGMVRNYVTTFVLPQTTTPQTQAQIAQNQQRAATRATSRNR